MGTARYHFSGIAGAGMNPLALVTRSRGHDVQGSDRSFDRGENADVLRSLRRAGVVIRPQDGTAVTPDIDRFVFSAAGSPGGSTSRNSGNRFHFGTGGVWPSQGA